LEPWIYEPVAQTYFEGGSTVVDDAGVWVAYASDGKATVLEVFSNPALATITQLNLQDGSIERMKTLQFEEIEADYWIQFPGWHLDYLYLVTDDQIRLIEASSGSQLTVWP
jgi:hypothetical protein